MKKTFTLRTLSYILLALGAILGLWFLIEGNFIFSGNIDSPDVDKAKQLQPFFTGLVAPLFTLAGALLVITNLQYQTKQNFITNFFNLLNQHHKLLDNISSEVYCISIDDKPSCKKDFFDDLAQRIAYDYYHLDENSQVTKDQFEEACNQKKMLVNPTIDAKQLKEIEKLKKIYDYYFHVHLSDLSHYFRSLFHLVTFINEQPFSKKFKQQYAGILRAQLSNYEMVLLSYNCMHEYGENFKKLIEKYRLIKSINNEDRINKNIYHEKIVPFDIIKKEYPKNFN